MNTLDRYLLREIVVPFVVGIGLFFVVVAFAQVLKVSDAVTGLGVTGGEIVQAFLYSLPPLLGLLIPVSMLFATLLGVGRLASDRELVATASVGISPYRLLRVPLSLSAVLAVICGLILVFGEPWGISGLREVITHSAQRAIATGVRPGQFNEWVPGVTFIANSEKNGQLQNVVFADRRDETRPIVISARRGRVGTGESASDIVFLLEDGAIVLNDEESGLLRVLRFEKSRYRLDIGRLVRKAPRTTPSIQGKTVPVLWRESRDPSKSRGRRAALTIVMHRKAALPLATVIFSLLAVPLALRAGSGARARGFLYSAALVGGYYYIGRAVELSARSGSFNPELAAWTPNILGLIGLGILLVRMRRMTV